MASHSYTVYVRSTKGRKVGVLKEFKSPTINLSYCRKPLLCVLENLWITHNKEGTWNKRDEKEVSKKLCCLTMANFSIGLLLEAIPHCLVNRGKRLRTMTPGILGKSKRYVGSSNGWLLVIWTSVTNRTSDFKNKWSAVKSLMPLRNPKRDTLGIR